MTGPGSILCDADKMVIDPVMLVDLSEDTPVLTIPGEENIKNRDNEKIKNRDNNENLIFYCQSAPVLGDTIPVFTVDGLDSPSIKVYQSCVDGTCECVHLIGGESSQLLPCRLASFLQQDGLLDLSPEERKFLWSGFTEGFDIVDRDCDVSYECANYKSILGKQFYNEMCGLILEELADGLVSEVEEKPRCVHSLGGVEKSNGSLRPITDCSMPRGKAINNHMSSTFKPFSYNSIGDVVNMLDSEDYMCVVDLKSAYRSVNVKGDQTGFQGFAWNFGEGNRFFKSNRMTFGLRCAPYIFDKISNFLVTVARFYGVEKIVNYLDDFIIVASSEEECLRQRNVLIELMKFFGFKISDKKVTEPSRVCVFLGITIDSSKMELSLPKEKVEKLENFLTECRGKKFVSKKILQKIGGLMSFCSQVVRGGRTFSRRIFDLCSKAWNRGIIRLDDETKKDLDWWLDFCKVFNCKSLIKNDCADFPMVSDASLKGFGAWAGKDYFYGSWSGVDNFSPGSEHWEGPPQYDNFHIHKRNINVYELWPVLVGLRRWAYLYKNTRVNAITDNMQVLAMLNTGRSKNKLCMEWLREIFWLCFIHNIEIFATYIRSADNVLADQLSRLDYKNVPNACTRTLLENNMCCYLSRPTAGESEKEAD